MKIGIKICLFGILILSSKSFAEGELKLALGATAYSTITLQNNFEGRGGDYHQEASSTFSLAYERPFYSFLSWGLEAQYAPKSTGRTKNAGPTFYSESSYNLSTMRFFANLVATKKFGGIYPYAGFGLGLSMNTLDKFSINFLDSNFGGVRIKKYGKTSNSFAYQIFGGLDFDITERFFAGFSIKYMNLGEVLLSSKQETDNLDKDGKVVSRNIAETITNTIDGDLQAFELNIGVGVKL